MANMDKPVEQPPPYSASGPQQQAATHVYMGGYGVQPPPYSAPPPGYQPYQPPPPAPGFVPSYGATTNVIIQPPIISVGACPACRVGILEDDFTCLGIFCAIFFFPLGILCCLALKNRRCSNCGAYFG